MSKDVLYTALEFMFYVYVALLSPESSCMSKITFFCKKLKKAFSGSDENPVLIQHLHKSTGVSAPDLKCGCVFTPSQAEANQKPMKD